MNPADPPSPGHKPPSDIHAMMNWALGADDPTEIISADTTPSAARPAFEKVGAVIGPFTLIKQLGQGGFGEVWQAEQHTPIRRTVALKLIKPGMASADVLQRFDAERQALAMMDHPNIARVFDAGATPDGRPWFAMELVDGSALTTYCDQRRLTIRQRLALFSKVCAAVQHAHQKAVLHRDLKPSNILVSEVDGQPVPKVIDFGIAKALEQPLTGGAAMTLQGQLIGTPQYMSPEQVGMTGDVDTRSDVYSLGVILYELLTGHPPLDPQRLRKAALDEICRIIREEEPPKPSTRIAQMEARMAQTVAEQHGTDTRRWTRELSGELDWIIMRALEKERERRYSTAQDFAEDIERHMRNEPVRAGPPGATYRLRKLVKRNKGAFGAAAALILVLVSGVVVSLWQRQIALRETSLARASRNKAEDILEYLLGDLRGKLRTTATLEVLRDVELQVDKYYSDLGLDESDSMQMKRRAISLENQGETRKYLGDLKGAQAKYEQSADIIKRLIELDPGNFEWQAGLASNTAAIGKLLQAQGDIDHARERLQKQKDIIEGIASRLPDDAHYQRAAARSYLDLGSFEDETGDVAIAMLWLEKANAILKPLAVSKPEDSILQSDYGSLCRQLSSTQRKLGRLADADSNIQMAVDIFERLLAVNPENASWMRAQSVYYSDLGFIKRDRYDHDGAARCFTRSQELITHLSERDPENLKWKRELSAGHNNLGSIMWGQAKTDEAMKHFQSGLETMRHLTISDPTNASWQRDLSVSLNWVARLKSALGDHSGAKKDYLESIAILKRLILSGTVHADWLLELVMRTRAYGDALWDQGDRSSAQEWFEDALKINLQLVEMDGNNVNALFMLSGAHDRVAMVRRESGQTQEAVDSYSAAALTLENLLSRTPDHADWEWNLALCYANIGKCKLILGDKGGADQFYMRAIERGTRALGKSTQPSKERSRALKIWQNQHSALSGGNPQNAATRK